MPHLPHHRILHSETQLSPLTYRALVWIAYAPQTLQELAAIMRVKPAHVGKRIQHLERLGLAVQDDKTVKRTKTTFSATEKAVNMISNIRA